MTFDSDEQKQRFLALLDSVHVPAGPFVSAVPLLNQIQQSLYEAKAAVIAPPQDGDHGGSG